MTPMSQITHCFQSHRVGIFNCSEHLHPLRDYFLFMYFLLFIYSIFVKNKLFCPWPKILACYLVMVATQHFNNFSWKRKHIFYYKLFEVFYLNEKRQSEVFISICVLWINSLLLLAMKWKDKFSKCGVKILLSWTWCSAWLSWNLDRGEGGP